MILSNKLNQHNEKTAVALGIFDGIHIGHRQVIRQAVDSGYIPTVLTFGGKVKNAGRLITETTKIKLLEDMGVAEYITLPFEEIKNMPPQEFVTRVLAEKLNAAKVCCGFNFMFGKNACANATDLKNLCREQGIETAICPEVDFNGEPVSSTVIRQLVENGDVVTANKMLGHPFGYEYEVINGQKLGRVLGTPTLNQRFESDFLIPKFGVYASYSVYDGKKYPSVTNIGVKPTVGSDYPLSETWIPDFSGDLYGENIEVRLLEFMRPEEKFGSIDILKDKIISDGEKSKKVFLKYKDLMSAGV